MPTGFAKGAKWLPYSTTGEYVQVRQATPL